MTFYIGLGTRAEMIANLKTSLTSRGLAEADALERATKEIDAIKGKPAEIQYFRVPNQRKSRRRTYSAKNRVLRGICPETGNAVYFAPGSIIQCSGQYILNCGDSVSVLEAELYEHSDNQQ